jgi:hypothetical protein
LTSITENDVAAWVDSNIWVDSQIWI